MKQVCTDCVPVSFVHVTDPYADETNTTNTTTQSHSQSQATQQHHHTIAQLPHSSYQHPQYVDVAATSLKAMIDPNLESGTGNGGGLSNGGQDAMTAGEMTEAETLNETILKALKQSDAEMGLRGQTGE